MRRALSFSFLLVLLCIILIAACDVSAPRDDTPESQRRTADPLNLLIIVVDTLRADHVGSYGGSAKTPSMDGLADAGVLFETAYSHIPVTAPAHASMFTGKLPFEHGVKINTQVLDSSFSTLAEVLRDRGWKTGAVVSLGVLKKNFGLDQGFDSFDDRFDRQWHRPAGEVTDAALDLIGRWNPDEPFFAFVHYSDPHSPYAPPGLEYPEIRVVVDDRIVRTVTADGLGNVIPLTLTPGGHEIRFEAVDAGGSQKLNFEQLKITHRRARLTLGAGWNSPEDSKPQKQNRTTALPVSLRAHVDGADAIDADLRFFSEERLSAAQVRERYRLEVEYVDREIGRLLNGLEASRRLANTVVVLTSDHGEGIGDHGLVGHIHQLYDTLTRVPFLVVAPGPVKPGSVSSVPARHVDLRPTVLALLGVDDPAPGDGVDLGSFLDGTEEHSVPPHFAMTFRPLAREELRAVISGRHKLIRNIESDTVELYDLVADPGELNSLFSARQSGSGRVDASLAQYLEDLLAQLDSRSAVNADTGDLDEEDLEQLRALGYLQ